MVKRSICRKCWHWRRKEDDNVAFCGYHVDTGRCRITQMTPEERKSGECRFFEAGEPKKERVRPMIVNPDPLARIVYESPRRKKQPVYDRDRMLTLYDQGKSDGEIAAAMGCIKDTVMHWRKSMELPPNRHKPHRKIDRERVRALYMRGLNDQEIAKEMNISHQSVSNWRNENGLPRNYRKNGPPIGPFGATSPQGEAGGASPSPTNKNGGESK